MDLLRDAADVVLIRTHDTACEDSGSHVARWLAAQARLGPDQCSDLAVALANVIMVECDA